MLSLLLALVLQITHPCDLPEQTTSTKGSTIGWCHDMKDDGGLIMQTIAFRVSINGVVTDLGEMLPIGNPSPSGMYYFQANLPNGLGRGLYPVYVTAYNNEGNSAPSNTVTWQIGGPPNKPTKPRISGND